MPIQDRKFFIQKHNIDSKREMEMMETNDVNTKTISGEALNKYAVKEQTKK